MQSRKKYSNYIALLVLLFIAAGYTACIKADNYAAPNATFYGTIYDSITGQPLQMDMNEARIQVLELSWTKTKPTPNPDFYANDSGYFYNSALFNGYYNVNVVGPFAPINSTQWPSVIDSTKSLTIQGKVQQNYTVAPILEIQWVTPPVYNSVDSSITATVTVNRGTKNPLYNTGAIKNINFYITGNAPYPGDASYDSRYTAIKNSFGAKDSVKVNGVMMANVFAFGQTYIVKSINKLAFAAGRTWWVRVGANTATSLPVVGTPYNYTSIQTITMVK
jgi:hypothetical protein